MPRTLSSSRAHRGVVAGRFPSSDGAAAACGGVKRATALASTASSPAGRLCADMSPPATSVAFSERPRRRARAWSGYGVQGATTRTEASVRYPTQRAVPWDASKAKSGLVWLRKTAA